ncbi:unnamed protein product [Miscanthus lutarioriparius]|uniref:Fe2OG dioxygenase domain-containing protein n=1 Tax=Miscanthus lutarioriparius TaxID=422564 RepID=A0A811RAF0_9POAL|nr:unnamed protein product [Miscanthus lutarioriparius]
MASESRLAQVGTTIPVRNVQDLAACNAGDLTAEALERYIRPDIDKDAVLYEHSGELPVVDLGRLFDPQSWEEEAAKLRYACEEWGFFQVLSHGVPEEVMANIKRDIQEFFQLPLDVIKELLRTNPRRPSRIWKSLEDYSVELKKVAHSIVTAIGRILNVDPELLSDKYAVQVLRMNYCPPCMSMAEKVLGFSPHSDGSFLTILSQVNSVQGLQIRRHDAWIPVKPHPEALLVNVGDLLEIMTNGRFKSIEHRVIINARKERLSKKLSLYRTVKVEDYFAHYMSNKLDGKRALDYVKLL